LSTINSGDKIAALRFLQKKENVFRLLDVMKKGGGRVEGGSKKVPNLAKRTGKKKVTDTVGACSGLRHGVKNATRKPKNINL